MTLTEELNKWLETKKSIDGKIIYRLVWSDKIFENRYGTFRDFTPSGLFIREVTETRLTRKYNYIHERWILEKWAPGNLTANRETPGTLNGDYIPVYVFEDKHGKYLAPNKKVLEFIIDFMEGRVPKGEGVDPRALEEKEIAYEVERMGDHPDFSTFGESRNAVAGFYQKGVKNVT